MGLDRVLIQIPTFNFFAPPHPLLSIPMKYYIEMSAYKFVY